MSRTLPPNPWSSLPTSPPFVLEADASILASLNDAASDDRRFDLTLLPEPFFGRPDAPVVVLALNPGWSPLDAAVHATTEFDKQTRKSLTHEPRDHPFLHLTPGADTPGAQWWRRIAKEPIQHLGIATVSRNLLCVEYFPYHSRRYKASKRLAPSQAYSFALVRSAIAREAEIVLMRSRRLWFGAVPELERYPRLHAVRNPQNPVLSAANLGGSFATILNRLSV